MVITQCPRCGKVFQREKTFVCFTCRPAEEEDYEKVHEVLISMQKASADELAEAAGVDREVVLRMLEQEMISNIHAGMYECGRCGAPAISAAKKLCQKCLTQLDQKLVSARRSMLESNADQRKTKSVHTTLDSKRR